MTEPILQLEQLTVLRGHRPSLIRTLGVPTRVGRSRQRERILDRIDLEANAGELIAVLGPSGAGKSTLLRAVAGLQRLSSGSVRCDGVDITQAPPQQRHLAMVMARPSLFQHLTVRENIAFAVNPEGVTPAEQVDVTLTCLSLDHLAHRHPSELSTGQQQMVALARAIVRRPRILLCDEPLAHVDTYAAEHLRQELVQAHERMGCTTLYVTHSLKEALSIADRAVYLEGGRVLQDDFLQDMHDCPATLSVARHLGASVFLPADAQIKLDVLGVAHACFTALGQELTVAGPNSLRDDCTAPHPQAPDAAGPGSPVLDAPTSGTPEPGAASHQPVVAVGHSDAISLTLLDERSPRIRGNIGQIIENTYLGTTHRLVIETELGVMDTVVDAHAPEAEAAPGDAVRVTLNEDRLWALPAT